MKYRCSHCSHTFELDERGFHRCPNCFWTTSLVPLEGVGVETLPSEVKKPMDQKSPAQKVVPWKFVFAFAIVVLVGGLAFFFLGGNRQTPHFPSFRFPALNLKPSFIETKSKKGSMKQKAVQAPETVLNQEEMRELERTFQLTIPRQLTEDEEEILKKQVSSPLKLLEKPKITQWKKEDFEKLLESEQKKRKITLGWWYVHSLVDVFEKHYPSAVKAFESGDYVLARELFIKSLSFPVYRNNVKLHRPIALVMLRPYVNDVIGKIAVINQHLVVQNLLADANGIFESYQAIFPILELEDWARALQVIADLKKRIGAFGESPQDAQVNYPAAFGQIDAEIQFAIRTEASPKPEAAISFKALRIDLDLKEKVIRQNTSEELLKVQKQYEQALKMIEDRNWEAARDVLQTVEFPPELAGDAKKKLALIEKILAIEEPKSKWKRLL